MSQNLAQTRALLDAANVQYTSEPFFSNFHGTRIKFETRKIAVEAAKVLGIDIKRYRDKTYGLEFFS